MLGIVLFAAILWGMFTILAGRARPGAVRRIARMHEANLGIKWAQTVHPNEYGGYDYSAWQRECRRFLETAVAPELGVFGRVWLLGWPVNRRHGRGWAKAHRIVGEVAIAAYQRMPATTTFAGTDPIAYEIFCAKILQQHGWSTALTKASGDQGIDIIAHRGPFCVVLQVKLWAGPVGNSAVQEIAAGRVHARADRAAVVSNAGFTRSAQQLAATNAVLLLHHSQLPDLDRLCGIPPPLRSLTTSR